MKCPKCQNLIDESTVICPHCKKVLKLICPICGEENKTNTCKKCGFVILNKCHKCGKVNPTISGVCSSCGFDTYTSVALNESNTDEFACLTIDFPNMELIKNVLGSNQLLKRFKEKLNNIIFNFAKSMNLRPQIIENSYIIRFSSAYSFNSSANKALKSTLELIKILSETNLKLHKTQNVHLNCKMTILKRDIYSRPEEYKSGVNIQLIYNNIPEEAHISGFQLIIDSEVYKQVKKDYSFETLSTITAKDQLVMLYELPLKDYIKIPKLDEIKIEEPAFDIDNYEDDEPAEVINDNENIKFESQKCCFKNIKANTVYENFITEIQSGQKIIMIKGDEVLHPVGSVMHKNFKLLNIPVIQVSVTQNILNRPYGLFSEIVAQLIGKEISPKFQQNYTEEDETTKLLNLVLNSQITEQSNPEDIRYALFETFTNLLSTLDKTIIYIEDFDNIDDTSLEILRLVFDNIQDSNLTFVLTAGKNYSLHKNIDTLLGNKFYTEINLRKANKNDLFSPELWEKVNNKFYFRKIVKNAAGSPLYFSHSLRFLLDTKTIKFHKGKFIELSENIEVIPTTLNELIRQRLKLLSNNQNLALLLASIIYLGHRCDIKTLELLGNNQLLKQLKELEDLNFIAINGDIVFVNNYNLIRECLDISLGVEAKRYVACDILTNIFDEGSVSPIKADLFNVMQAEKLEFKEWYNLSLSALSLGDFSAYLKCSLKLLKLTTNNTNESIISDINEFKLEIYRNITNMLYNYSPAKIQNIANIILEDLEQNNDNESVAILSNKMLQGAMNNGNYTQAKNLLNKILSVIPNATINATNLNVQYLLTLFVKTEVLFNIGDYENCANTGEELINALNPELIEKICPPTLSIPQFKELYSDTVNIAGLSKILRADTDIEAFLTKAKKNCEITHNPYLSILQQAMLGKNFELEKPKTNEKFNVILYNLLNAIKSFDGDYEKFANNIYPAKTRAKTEKLHTLELFCDLIIGFSYSRLQNTQKAYDIYNDVLTYSKENGLNSISNFVYYLISDLKIIENKFESASGIINNAINLMEQNKLSNELLLMLLQYNMCKILKAKKQDEQFSYCLKQIEYLAKNTGYGHILEVI